MIFLYSLTLCTDFYITPRPVVPGWLLVVKHSPPRGEGQ